MGGQNHFALIKFCPMNCRVLVAILAAALAFFLGLSSAGAATKPNIVFLLCDDLGYGDAKCNNPQGKIATPNVDKLAAQGIRFTDAHSSSSVCTPTRYSLLTGRYNWRSRLQSGVLGGLSPRLIEPGRLTVAKLLKQHGYHTAAIGKWHLGLDWAPARGKPAPERNEVEKSNQVWSVDFTKPIAGGPNSVGFEYFFGIAASLDMVPYTFIENDRVTVVPTVDRKFPMTLGKTNKFTRFGPATPEFKVEEVLPILTDKAVRYVAERAASAKSGQPFFLYLPFNSPHTPIAPTADWRGKSGLNAYADFVMETDWAVGQVLTALERYGLADNTLVIFTSDNGCSPEANLPELHGAGHDANGPLRGHKADIWDGGHRVPFIVRWPGQVAASSTSEQLICLMDFMATCADILGTTLPDDAGEDSVSFLPALIGKPEKPLREALVHHSISGRFAIRQGPWKLELCPGSGGWSSPGDPQALKQGLPDLQLYDLTTDLPEQKNLQALHPEITERLTKIIERYVTQGRSTPGRPQKNDAQIDIWKKPKANSASKQ